MGCRHDYEYDVIVVGARCAGAPLAMLLARMGHSVLLADRAAFPSDTISTHWILWPGVECLARWGLLDTLRAGGCPPIERIRVDFGATVIAGTPTCPAGPAVTYAPRRTILDTMLVDAAREAGARVQERLSVAGILSQGDMVTGVHAIGAAGGRVVAHARLVVGADGRNSTVARCVSARMTHDRGALAATAYGYWSGVGTTGAEIWIRPGLGAALWPTHGDLAVVAVTLSRQALRADRVGAASSYRLALNQIPELSSRLRQGRLTTKVHSVTSLRNFYRQSHGPGWALTGDAGHQKDPIGARGISDAFTDAENLSAAIHDGLTGKASMHRALARYQARRNAARAEVFDFVCRQATLSPLDDEFGRLVHTLAASERSASDLLSVFAGVRTLKEFFSPDGQGRMPGLSPMAAS